MADKSPSKSSKPSPKSLASDKKSPKVKDLSPKKDPRGGATDHPPKGGGKNNDY